MASGTIRTGAKIVYDSELSSNIYTYTVTEDGTYLAIIRANASSASTSPNIQIITPQLGSQNTGATGGSTSCYQVATLSVGDTIYFGASDYLYATGYESYGRRTIIKLT